MPPIGVNCYPPLKKKIEQDFPLLKVNDYFSKWRENFYWNGFDCAHTIRPHLFFAKCNDWLAYGDLQSLGQTVDYHQSPGGLIQPLQTGAAQANNHDVP